MHKLVSRTQCDPEEQSRNLPLTPSTEIRFMRHGSLPLYFRSTRFVTNRNSSASKVTNQSLGDGGSNSGRWNVFSSSALRLRTLFLRGLKRLECQPYCLRQMDPARDRIHCNVFFLWTRWRTFGFNTSCAALLIWQNTLIHEGSKIYLSLLQRPRHSDNLIKREWSFEFEVHKEIRSYVHLLRAWIATSV
jgi:hypothetical protein